MKKVISLAALLLLTCFSFGSAVFAETLPVTTPPTVAPAAVVLDKEYADLLEAFFTKIAQKDFAGAYAMMDANFAKNYTQAEFELIVTSTGLTTSSSKNWTATDKNNPPYALVVRGDFTAPDQLHTLLFPIVKENNALKLDAVLENMTFAGLKKRFPTKAALKELVKNDLALLTPLFQNDKSDEAYGYLSKSAQKRTKLDDLKAVFDAFKKKNVDITLPQGTKITMQRQFPRLSAKGLMLAKGHYDNAKYRVTFTVAYDYEWRWKIGIFSFNTRPLPSALPPAPTPQ